MKAFTHEDHAMMRSGARVQQWNAKMSLWMQCQIRERVGEGRPMIVCGIGSLIQHDKGCEEEDKLDLLCLNI